MGNGLTKPLMIWDGECGFCAQWIQRWKKVTHSSIAYETYQSVGAQFPQIPTENFRQAVHLVEPDGRITRGAEAVFRALRDVPRLSWLLKAYERVPAFAALSEFGYRLVASNRSFFSKFMA
jgi:predicted DCC family thiol-disulfide oxidoreductase YuxK